MKTTATSSWPQSETDPQRVEILAAADRLLAGTPIRSTGNLSVVQLATEASIKYWIIAQKHTDLRDHFQRLAGHVRKATAMIEDHHDVFARLQRDHGELKRHCDELKQLLQDYAQIINELTLENQALREQTLSLRTTITPLPAGRRTDP